MAHSASAKKRIRQNNKRRLINRMRRSTIRTFTRRFDDAVEAKDVAKAEETFRDLQAKLDKAAKGNQSVHRNKAARRKSRLQRQLNKLKAAGQATA